MTLGIRSKLFLLSLSLIGCSLIAAEVYFSNAVESHLTRQIRDDLFVRLDIVAQAASEIDATLEDTGTWDAFADRLGEIAGSRVTVIRADGVVLGDSEVELDEIVEMENHAARPEIVQALAEVPYWSYEDEYVGAAGSLLGYSGARGVVDGLLSVSAFGCAPDSVMSSVLAQAARRAGVSYMSLILDEHSGQAGLITRLEAFVDMLARRKEQRRDRRAGRRKERR